LLDVFRARLEYPELKRSIVQQADRYRAETVVIEDKASGTQLIQDLRHDGFDKVVSFEGVGDKEMRLFSVTAKFEGGFVHVPEQAEWLESYLFELVVFPKGKYDDQVDSTSQALAWIRDGYDKHCYGLIELFKQMEAESMAPKIPEPRMCSKCNVEMQQKVPNGLRCAHCGEQWSSAEKPRLLSRYDVLRSRGF
jgi:predicted phage terminase large subunit-like protein